MIALNHSIPDYILKGIGENRTAAELLTVACQDAAFETRAQVCESISFVLWEIFGGDDYRGLVSATIDSYMNSTSVAFFDIIRFRV